MVASGIGARGRGALRNNNYKTRARNRQERLQVSPAHTWKAQMRESTGNRAKNSHTALRPLKSRARRDRAGHGEERTGQAGSKSMKKEDTNYHREGDLQREEVRLRQRAKHFKKLTGGMAAVEGYAQHFPEHSDADLKANAGQKTEKRRMGKEVGEKAKLQKASE